MKFLMILLVQTIKWILMFLNKKSQLEKFIEEHYECYREGPLGGMRYKNPPVPLRALDFDVLIELAPELKIVDEGFGQGRERHIIKVLTGVNQEIYEYLTDLGFHLFKRPFIDSVSSPDQFTVLAEVLSLYIVPALAIKATPETIKKLKGARAKKEMTMAEYHAVHQKHWAMGFKGPQ